MLYSTIQIKQFLNTICTLRFFGSICFLYLGLATIALSEAGSINEIKLADGIRESLTVNVLESPEKFLGEGPFITTWKTDNIGTTGVTQIEIPTAATLGVVYNYSIYWEEVNNVAINGAATAITGNHTIDFPVAGTYRVEISGDFPRIYFNNVGDKSKILTVEQWGAIAWTDMSNAFFGCNNLTIPATDAPDLSLVTSLNGMFRGATSLNQDINHWDVSSITNMGFLFRGASIFNQALNSWNVSNVTNMEYLFRDATTFNQDISSWNVSKVTLMNHMFMRANKFNQSLNDWKVGQVTTMASMFAEAASFNQDISDWDISSLTTTTTMFQGASSFNQAVGGWNMMNVTSMNSMFRNAIAFNQNIANWEVSSVTDMRRLFEGATDFNQDISNWDVGKVTLMGSMFSGASSFNQDISGWNVSNLSSMDYMFYLATDFSQDISKWDIGDVTNMSFMLSYSGLSPHNYDLLLNGWLNNPNGLKTGVTLGVHGLRYCAAGPSRSALITDHAWSIVGDQTNCTQIITFNALPEEAFGNDDFKLNATVSSGLTLIYTSSDPTVATINDDSVTIVGVGTTTITASQPGDTYYSAAISVSREFRVVKAEHTITFDALDPKIIGDPAFELTATASSGLPVTYASSDEAVATVTGSTVNIVGAGVTTITASQPGNENYNAATSVEQSLDVNKKSQTIAFGALSPKTILDPAFDLTATASSGLDITYISSDETVASVSGSTVTIVGLGTAIITASQAGNDEYAPAAEVMQELVVGKATQIITMEPIADKESNAPDFNVLVSASSGLDVNISISGPATISGKTISLNGTAGTVTLTAVQSGNQTYLAADPIEISFDVILVTGLAELEKEGIKIYPNPTSDYLNIEVSKSKKLTISLLGADGSLVSEFIVNSQRLDLSSLKAGVYILKIISSDQPLYYKIIKQ